VVNSADRVKSHVIGVMKERTGLLLIDNLESRAEARRRVDDALLILKGTQDYPSDRIALDSEVAALTAS
jgi:hypothetical protein